jgi:hypothetical protein
MFRAVGICVRGIRSGVQRNEEDTYGNSQMQRSRIRQRVEMPSFLAHCIANGVDINGVASECNDGYERVTKDVEVGG